MRERLVTLPELALIGATRGMLGFGAGLLLSNRIGRDRRKIVGFALLAVGALSTIPLAMRVFRGKTNRHRPAGESRPQEAAAMMAD